MNYNESIRNNREKRWNHNAVTIQMNSKNDPDPRRSKRTVNTTPSSASLKWKNNQNNILNSVLQTGSSSRSHSSSNDYNSRVILALSEGRGEAACEVGIAAIDLSQPKLILCQISDTQSFINTLSKINVLNPTEIVIPLTFVGTNRTNRLVEKVKEYFCDVKITAIARSAFNRTNGMTSVTNLCIPAMNSMLLILQNRYYALAAASGLLTYIENILNVIYSNHSLKIQYQESEGSTIIDIMTADKLELVACAKNSLNKQNCSLYSIMNFCLTKIGARTLRASILQPPSTLQEIESRLDCVAELIEQSVTGATYILRSTLEKIVNVDQLLNVVTLIPKEPNDCSERQLNYLLLLNSFFEILDPLRECLGSFKNEYFKKVLKNLNKAEFEKLKLLIRTVIVDDARPAKGSNGILQRCFAIKPGINTLLDLVRKSYTERLDGMREYVKNLGEKYSLPLSLNNNNTKGFHIILPLKSNQKRTFNKKDLPKEFIQVDKLSNSFTMKTTRLLELSERIDDIMTNILKISNVLIRSMLITIKGHVAIFYELCEDISKLDMLQSLAKLGGDTDYVRPKFADYMEIENGRHPILDFISSETPIPNTISASDGHNMHIISGPNGSGKSILIRQLVLIQVMAQVGCFVPAQSATLRIADRILARISLDDNADIGASAFVLEIMEVEFFMQAMSKNTLIIIDELCRSTSVEEGTSLAMSICEKFARSPAFVFFTTHFKAMAILGNIYFNIKIWQMQTLIEEKGERVNLNFLYKLIDGMTTLENYGIYVTRSCWPKEVVDNALKLIDATKRKTHLYPNYNEKYACLHLKYDLEEEFRLLKKKGKLTPEIIKIKLKNYEETLNSICNNQNSPDDHPQNTSPRLLQINVENDTRKSGSGTFSNSKSDLNDNSTSTSNYVVQKTGKTSFGNSPSKTEELSENYKEISKISYDNLKNKAHCSSDLHRDESKINVDNYKDQTPSDHSLNDSNLNVNNVTFNWSQNPNQCFNLYKNEQVNRSVSAERNFNSELFFNKQIKENIYNNFPADQEAANNFYDNFGVKKSCEYEERIQGFSFELEKGQEDYSNIKENKSNQKNFKFKVPSNKYRQKNVDESENINESFVSINEANFSCPLDQNREKTSTPLTKFNSCPDYQIKNIPLKLKVQQQQNNVSLVTEESYQKEMKNKNGQSDRENASDCTVTKENQTEYLPYDAYPYQESSSKDVHISKNENISFNKNKELESSSHSSKNTCLNKSRVMIYLNNSVNLHPDEIESIVTELESVSECFSQNEWDDENNIEKEIQNEENRQESPISYSPNKSLLEKIEEVNQNGNTIGTSLPTSNSLDDGSEGSFKFKLKRSKIKVPFRSSQIFVKKPKRNRRKAKDGKNINSDEKYSKDPLKTLASLEYSKEKDDNKCELIVTQDKNSEDKKIIILQNIIIRQKDDVNEKTETIEGKEKNSGDEIENNCEVKSEITSNHPGAINYEELFEVKENNKKINSELELFNKTELNNHNANENSKSSPQNSNQLSSDTFNDDTQIFHEYPSNTSSSSLKKNKKQSKRTKKFMPPFKLTKKEIVEEYQRQDKLLLESNYSDEALKQVLNRPSVKSIQHCEFLATIYKTEEGVLVTQPPLKKPRRSNKFKTFSPPFSEKLDENFSLFSNKNTHKFEKMLQDNLNQLSNDSSIFGSKEKKVEQPHDEFGIVKNVWDFSKTTRDEDEKQSNLFNFGLENNKKSGEKSSDFKMELSFSNYDTSLSFENLSVPKPPLANDTDIDGIIAKYLNQ